jgi:hypothetical protein
MHAQPPPLVPQSRFRDLGKLRPLDRQELLLLSRLVFTDQDPRLLRLLRRRRDLGSSSRSRRRIVERIVENLFLDLFLECKMALYV